MTADRRISKRLKGKVKSNWVIPARLYGTETVALTEIQQQRLGTKNIKSKESRQEKNGGVSGRDGSAEELDRETGRQDT